MSKIIWGFPQGAVFDKTWKAMKAQPGGEAYERIHPGAGGELLSEGDWKCYREAGRVILEITGQCAATLFLAGHGFASGKEVIVISQNEETLNFGLPSGKVICYGGDREHLRAEIKARLEGKPTRGEGPELKGAEGFFQSIFGDIVEKHGYQGKMEISMDGEKTIEIREQEMDLALVEELVKRARGKGLRLKLL